MPRAPREVFSSLQPVPVTQAAIGTAYLTLLNVGAVGGRPVYRLDGAQVEVIALGTGTTTVKVLVTVDVNGAARSFAAVDRTATGIVNLLKELGAIASPHIKVEVKRNEGTGTDGEVDATFCVSKAEFTP